MILLSHTLDTPALAFLRHTEVPREVALVAINPGPERLQHHLMVPYPHLYHDLRLGDALGSGRTVTMEAGSVHLDMPPQSAAVFVPHLEQYRHYSFYK